MLEALKSLFENNVVSEDVRAEIESAWESRIVENRTQVTQQLREEFAQRYEHDKQVMVEAIDRMLGDQLREEIAQFVEDRNQLAEAKAKVVAKSKKDAEKMKEFIIRQLSTEVKDLHEDQKQMADKFIKLEQFVVEALAQEIAEFHIDKKDIAETKVRLIREGKDAFSQVKGQFIQRAAKLVESTVETTLSKEIGQLKEDIETARRNDFGRKLFEAFANEYQTSYLNERSETSKLLKVIDMKELQVAQARNDAAQAQQLAESKEHKIKALVESKERQEVMNELIAPLNGSQKQIMTELLESVQTTKLRSSFDKYLSAVVAGEAPQKRKALIEAKEVTGNKIPNSASSSETDNNIIDIRKLAGLKI
jgi:hypothetical protein